MSASIPPDIPAPIDPAAGGRGWGKKILIGCGAVALILATCLVGVILYLRQHPETATDFVMKQVDTSFASDVTPQEKDDLHAAYAEFRTALKEHRVPNEPLEGMRSRLTVRGSQNEITREQVRDLTALFRRAAGAGSPGSPGVPVPSPRPSP
ncbi:MAG TPA: hypothetical protein VFZ57_02375 [Thermoanaerobaculia bacterium]|nr:hypothetical protein [Thermoanaerobaculia bacterium]